MVDLTEKEKLVWLGFKQPKQSMSGIEKEVSMLSDEVTFEEFQADLDAYDLSGDGNDQDISSYAEFKTYLTDQGFTSDEADTFIEKIKNNFDSYADFETYTEDTATSWETFKNEFGTASTFTGEIRTEDGEPVAGIRFHDSAAVSYDGIVVPAGTVEVFGTRVEFSEQDAPQTGEALMSFSNLQVSDQLPQKFETITISADIDNIGDAGGDAFPQLKIDGVVVATKGPITITNGGSDSVSFSWSFNELQSVDVTIATLDPLTVSVIPAGLEVT